MGFIILSMFLIVIAFFVFIYVFTAKWHNKLLEYMEYENAWFAWIPILSNYALADMVCSWVEEETVKLGNNSISKSFIRLYPIIALVVNFIPGIGQLASLIVYLLLGGYVYQQVFAVMEECDPEQCKGIGMISGWINIIGATKFKKYFS